MVSLAESIDFIVTLSQSFPLSQHQIQKCLLIFSAHSIFQQKMNFWDHCYLAMPKYITPKAFIRSIFTNIGTVQGRGCELASILWPRTGPKFAKEPLRLHLLHTTSPELHFIHVSRTHSPQRAHKHFLGRSTRAQLCIPQAQNTGWQNPGAIRDNKMCPAHLWPCNPHPDEDTGLQCQRWMCAQANDKASSRKQRAQSILIYSVCVLNPPVLPQWCSALLWSHCKGKLTDLVKAVQKLLQKPEKLENPIYCLSVNTGRVQNFRGQGSALLLPWWEGARITGQKSGTKLFWLVLLDFLLGLFVWRWLFWCRFNTWKQI